jgi:hypothetical protein
MSNQVADYPLLNPRVKMTAKSRRREMRLRERIVNAPRTSPKDPMVKLTEKLASYSAGRLVRFIKQSARRASSAKYILAKLHSDSVFRPALEQQQKSNLIAFIAASTELDNRGNPEKRTV